MALTTVQQISIGALCGLYTSNEIASGRRAGGVIDKRLPHLINAVNQGLKWLYEYDPTNDDLVPIGNYLISICRNQFKAQGVLALNNGGTISPIVPSNIFPNALDFIVSDDSFIPTGGTVKYIPQYIGYTILLARGSQVQNTTPQFGGAAYYAWNYTTGYLSLLPVPGGEALEGEPFHIQPIGLGGGASSVPGSDVRIIE